MYLSLLRLNPRSRRARTEASRPYELHRSLMRTFPNSEDGGPGRVLFRLDVDRRTGAMAVLVQSEKEPDWTPLESSQDLLLRSPQHKTFEPVFARGQALYFRLRANPTVKRAGKRLGLPREEDQLSWLGRKGAQGGFEVVSVTVIPEGMTRDGMTDKDGSRHDLSLLSVRFEGVLRVVEPDLFRATLAKGVGSGKGLGFGLLSIAPLKG